MLKFKSKIDASKENSVIKSLSFLKNKAKTLEDIYNNSKYIINESIEISSNDRNLIDENSKKIIKEFIEKFEKIPNASKDNLEPIIKGLIETHKTNFKGVGQPLRLGLVGSKFGPGIYDIILSLDASVVVKRLQKIIK